MRDLPLDLPPADRNGEALPQLVFSFAIRVRSIPMQQLVDEHSECPHVSLGTVDVVDEALGRHVQGRAYTHIFEFFSI